MSYETPITDADLHAYLDDQLSDARRLQVEQWLQDNPAKLRELNELRRIDAALQSQYAPILDEAVPKRLRIHLAKGLYQRVAAAAGFIIFGMMIGWQTNRMVLTENDISPLENNLLQPATFAHAVYTAEKRHPVEVSAKQEKHLMKWLSNRLHADIKAPMLSTHGYELIGGRLLPSTNRMAAQFMYQNPTGNRVTLYVRRIKGVNADAMFQFTHQNGFNAFYWIDGELGYTLSGELEKKQLLDLTITSHQQLGQSM